MYDFTFQPDDITLPGGAFAKAHRCRLRHRGQSVLALTQGDFRPYVYPLYSPAGFAVTSEAPSDHPHHSSLWIAADHLHLLMPAAGNSVEEYTYNFYVNEAFQGRAPGRLVETAVSGREVSPRAFEIVQKIEWRGPVEWAARAGRLAAVERRTITVSVGEAYNRIDVTSQLTASDFAIRLGPTRHAWFNVRVADSMIVANGGVVIDDTGHSTCKALCGEGARWVDFSGPVGGNSTAGITVIPHPLEGRTPFWFVADWGVITVGPFRSRPLDLEPGEAFESTYSVIVHDGDGVEAQVAEIAREILGG
ncbi:MAG TPA: DUF6807 family protein [Rhizobiaceae bacterium]|nr:DUF6807 family protein [Rhizobiaceae bacterium]